MAACSSNPISPFSVKYFPVHMPSSSGDTTSSDTALSSKTLGEIFYKILEKCFKKSSFTFQENEIKEHDKTDTIIQYWNTNW